MDVIVVFSFQRQIGRRNGSVMLHIVHPGKALKLQYLIV